jgi:hypothetical protein
MKKFLLIFLSIFILIKNRIMKAKPFLLFPLLLAIISFSGCKKEESRGTIFSSQFDTDADLSLWTVSSGGEATIENEALKLKVVSSCFAFETADLISVRKGKTYTLKFKGKVDPTLVGEPAYCVGDYMVYIIQGSDYLIQDGFGDYLDWTPKSFLSRPHRMHRSKSNFWLEQRKVHGWMI